MGGAGLGPPTELGAGDVSRLEESGRLIAPSTSSGNSLGNCNALKVHQSRIKIRPKRTCVLGSVPDRRHFGTDPDAVPEPPIRTSD